MVNQLALLRLDTDKNARVLNTFFFDSKEAREDNLPTLPALRRAIDRESQGSAHLRVTARTLVDHCQRLLKEKETLQRQVEAMKNAPLFPYDSAAAISQPWPNAPRSVSVPMTFIKPPDFQAARHGACAFASSHRAGIRCGVCGETGT